MAGTYENALRELSSWVDRAGSKLSKGEIIVLDSISANTICKQISMVANGIEGEYPFYSVELKNIVVRLFDYSTYREPSLNSKVFGELSIIVRHIVQEPVNISVWKNIHPRIIKISKSLFCDGYYDIAAEKAVKEIECRLRELFQKLKPDNIMPVRVGDIIGALISENGAYHFADLSTPSGKDYRRGVQSLLEGIFAAYRNPAAHGNVPCTERGAIEQITLASQLMYVLDKE